ncbi:hypothetical protein SGGMMB4_05082 [Sodalis glossinidius str. 'morsitans']|uniref:Uncharacterized protein n=1 Tax=Sodalis glossinidius (strain morsitans) TaxID=343509 RepID=A0A193QMQ0_SODGM|nr:hypothetical protein SGGMMB4_05082 [Sodalis glossinidius str. 'morsitans']
MNPNIYFKYCRIQRAADFLNCKTDDILHYASLGLIDLCLMVSELSAYLFL